MIKNSKINYIMVGFTGRGYRTRNEAISRKDVAKNEETKEWHYRNKGTGKEKLWNCSFLVFVSCSKMAVLKYLWTPFYLTTIKI